MLPGYASAYNQEFFKGLIDTAILVSDAVIYTGEI